MYNISSIHQSLGLLTSFKHLPDMCIIFQAFTRSKYLLQAFSGSIHPSAGIQRYSVNCQHSPWSRSIYTLLYLLLQAFRPTERIHQFYAYYFKHSLDLLLYNRVECGDLFLIGQNRSGNQRSGMILGVQIQNFSARTTRRGTCASKFSFSKNSRGPKY